MANKAKSFSYWSHRPRFHLHWQTQDVGSSETISFHKGDFLAGRCLSVQQPVSPVGEVCLACKLAWQLGSLHPAGKICMLLYSIKKGRREGNTERPFPSDITKTHHCYLADIWTCSNIYQINGKMATGFKNLRTVPLVLFLLRTVFKE